MFVVVPPYFTRYVEVLGLNGAKNMPDVSWGHDVTKAEMVHTAFIFDVRVAHFQTDAIRRAKEITTRGADRSEDEQGVWAATN